MPFAQENGYTPRTLEQIIDDVRVGINTQFADQLPVPYTPDTFPGSGFYKYVYVIAQKVQSGEIKASEVFQKLQSYIALVNDTIQRPGVSAPGLEDTLRSEGYVASVKPIEEVDAGKLSVAVDLDDGADDYAEEKLAVATIIKDSVAAGIVTLGTEVESLPLSNGQSFDWKFFLPDRIPVLIRASIVESENNLQLVPTDIQIRQMIFDKINETYKLGKNFEPQRYLTLTEVPWAATVLVEWSDDDGDNWFATVFDAEFDELFEFDLEDISVLVT